jgi:ribosomal protein S18 acetylase RimI-like enzyme
MTSNESGRYRRSLGGAREGRHHRYREDGPRRTGASGDATDADAAANADATKYLMLAEPSWHSHTGRRDRDRIVGVIEIRPFRPDESEAVVVLWDACDLIRPWNDPRRDIERKLRVDPELFLVAVDDELVIGTVMAGYEGHRGWINYLAVDPSRRRQGVGSSLMEEAERLLAERGSPKINLQIRSENADVIAFYGALGYQMDDVVSLGKRLVDDSADDSPADDGRPYRRKR